MKNIMTRQLTLERANMNTSSRTVPAIISSTAPVSRDFGYEVLVHEASAIDLSRADRGLPLLFAHDHKQPIGRVEQIRLDKNTLRGMLRFSENPHATEIWNDVQAGILTDLSIGYSIDAVRPGKNDNEVLVTRWTPHEASVVSVPADPGARIGRAATPADSTSSKKDTPQMSAQNINYREIRTLVDTGRFDAETADRMAVDFEQRGLSVDESNREILTRRAEASDAFVIRPPMSGFGGYTTDAPLQQTRAFAEVVAGRIGGPAPSEQARAFSHLKIGDMLRTMLHDRGENVNRLSATEILTRAHTSGDFSQLLLGTGRRVLRNAYASYNGGIKRIAKAATAPDFRAKQALSPSEAPTLDPVNEHGEFTQGSMAEAKTSYSLKTFGRIFSISRQALINDDLGAFGSMLQKFGVAAAERENAQLVDLLTSNPNMSDGVALFHANHGNLAASGAVISVTTLGAARKAMRLQTGLDGTTPIDCTPAYLVVPAALETVAEQFLATLSPTVATDANPFTGRLELVVDPRLDAKSATAWYLAARPDIIDTIEYSYLDGFPGPVVEVENGWDIDATEIKCRLDFGCGVLDWRGLYKNAGA